MTPRSIKRRWLRAVLVLLAALLAGNLGLSLALRGDWARRGLSARLSAGFGRPVEVGRFGFNLLSGLRLEAQSVTVYDDPRFGQEYFLRAEQLTASVRWSALLQGRFEFGTVSLTRPSLNLVRLADGQWNIESWLPPLASADRSGRGGTGNDAGATVVVPAGSASTGTAVARLSRIEVEDGRINFKRDSRKLALALVAVEGRFDHDSAGQWNIDVQANPMRAPASLQQAGTLRVRGVVGGVSTRLRPARLSLTWEDGSLADLSRLAQGRDYGIRGTLDAEVTARIDDAPGQPSAWGEWAVDGQIRLQGVHGWALAARTNDPNANVNFEAKWRPADYRLVVTRCLVEAPQSRIEAVADLDWSRGFRPSAQVTSSRVGLADLLDWRRALRQGVADDLAIEGTLEAQAIVAGWPLRIDDLTLASVGATIRTAGLPGPIRVGPVVTEWTAGTLKLKPTPVFLPVAAAAGTPVRGGPALDSPPSSSALLVEGSIGPLPAMSEFSGVGYHLAISGAARRAQDLLTVARAWDGSVRTSWTAEGPVSFQLAIAGRLRSGTTVTNGAIQARGLRLTSALVNRPLLINAATMDLRGDEQRINLQSAQAIGARWTGSLRRPREDAPWEFDLSADHLDAADFYAWLGAPAPPNLLQRMLPFGSNAAPVEAASRGDAPARLRGRGRLRIAELFFAPLQVERIDAGAVIDGDSLILRQGHADLLGGQLSGNLAASLLPEPSYSFDGQFARLDLGDIAAMASFPGRANGLASGELKLTAHGPDRASLAASLEGQGALRARDAWLGQFDLTPAVATPPVDARADLQGNPFAVTARFQIAARRLRLDQVLLARSGMQTEVIGTVDFARRLDLRVQSLPRPLATEVTTSAQSGSWTIAGTLDAPRITAAPSAAPTLAPGNDGGVPSAAVTR